MSSGIYNAIDGLKYHGYNPSEPCQKTFPQASRFQSDENLVHHLSQLASKVNQRPPFWGGIMLKPDRHKDTRYVTRSSIGQAICLAYG